MKEPMCTYRVQFHKHFTFSDFEKVIDYLFELGVDTVYASPIFESMPGSTHGYDVTNPFVINEEIGTIDELMRIRKKLTEKKMLWLQDIVPNHMAFSARNPWLHDVLREGPQSDYADFFDIDFRSPHPWLTGKLLAPFLGSDIETAVREGSIKLVINERGFYLDYYDNLFPLNTSSLKLLAFHARDAIAALLNQTYDALMASDTINARDEKWSLCTTQLLSNDYNKELNELLNEINGNAEALFEILREQHYVLCRFDITDKLINYRRFFTINGLISLRMEDQKVFEAYHSFIVRLCREGVFDGLRIDHIDGLLAPEQYCRRLKEWVGNDVYVVVEKILAINEQIPERWQIDGTTGYELLAMTGKLFTEAEGAARIDSFYRGATHNAAYSDEVAHTKKMFLETFMAGELDNITEQFCVIEELRHYDKSILKQSLSAIMVALPVYRIYPTEGRLPEQQQQVLEAAVKEAVEKYGLLANCIRDVTRLFITGDKAANVTATLNRCMQLSGPLAAKGIEDTTFYNYNAFIAHNEVGNAPGLYAVEKQDFFSFMKRRRQQFPFTLNATATHDTKRGEDNRTRLYALSEMPDKWIKWLHANIRADEPLGVPTVNDQFYIFQTMIGGLPANGNISESDKERLKAAVTKGLRESKRNSSWNRPNAEYEAGCNRFIDDCLEDERFTASLRALLADVNKVATRLSISQTALKLLSPGVADIYQGTESGEFSYVDPDNRRAVDFAASAAMLTSADIFANDFSEQKMAVTKRLLQFRNEHRELFSHGSYEYVDVNDTSVFCYSFTHNTTKVLVAIGVRGSRRPSFTLPVSLHQPYDVIRDALLTGDLIDLDEFPVAVVYGQGC